jgi:DNA-directed RNA polymerase specialized sigma24 family protein
MKTNRFNTTKEELAILGSQFNSEAFPLIEKFYLTSYWIVLNKRNAKKFVKETFKLAIEYCDKTKNYSDWNSWIHRIWMRILIENYSERENDINTHFDFIDHIQINENEVNNLLNNILSDSSKNLELTKETLIKLPAVLRIPLIMNEIHQLDYESISDLIDVPKGVIATRVYRARKLFTLLRNENFNYEDHRKLNKDYPDKIIFDLRRCAQYVDHEINEIEKNEFESTLKNNSQYQGEVLIQVKVKGLFENLRSESHNIKFLQSSIKRRAKKRFGTSF